MTQETWKLWDILISDHGTKVQFWEFNDNPETFDGVNLADGDVSGFWLRSHFKKWKPLPTLRYRKDYYVTAAVRRLFERGHIDKEQSIAYLMKKAKLPKNTAHGTVDIWIANMKAPKFHDA